MKKIFIYSGLTLLALSVFLGLNYAIWADYLDDIIAKILASSIITGLVFFMIGENLKK